MKPTDKVYYIEEPQDLIISKKPIDINKNYKKPIEWFTLKRGKKTSMGNPVIEKKITSIKKFTGMPKEENDLVVVDWEGPIESESLFPEEIKEVLNKDQLKKLLFE